MNMTSFNFPLKPDLIVITNYITEHAAYNATLFMSLFSKHWAFKKVTMLFLCSLLWG